MKSKRKLGPKEFRPTKGLATRTRQISAVVLRKQKIVQQFIGIHDITKKVDKAKKFQ